MPEILRKWSRGGMFSHPPPPSSALAQPTLFFTMLMPLMYWGIDFLPPPILSTALTPLLPKFSGSLCSCYLGVAFKALTNWPQLIWWPSASPSFFFFF